MQNICYKFKIINFSDLKCINTSIHKLHLRRFLLTTQIFVANLKKCYFIIANVNKPFILFCFIFIPILGFGLDLKKNWCPPIPNITDNHHPHSSPHSCSSSFSLTSLGALDPPVTLTLFFPA